MVFFFFLRFIFYQIFLQDKPTGAISVFNDGELCYWSVHELCLMSWSQRVNDINERNKKSSSLICNRHEVQNTITCSKLFVPSKVTSRISHINNIDNLDINPDLNSDLDIQILIWIFKF